MKYSLAFFLSIIILVSTVPNAAEITKPNNELNKHTIAYDSTKGKKEQVLKKTSPVLRKSNISIHILSLNDLMPGISESKYETIRKMSHTQLNINPRVLHLNKHALQKHFRRKIEEMVDGIHVASFML
jgi:hypothetical protein